MLLLVYAGGGIAAVCLEPKELETKSGKSETRSELQEHLKAFECAWKLQSDKRMCSLLDRQYIITFYTNCVQSRAPPTRVSVDDAVFLLDAFPANVRKLDGKGVPLSYALMPLTSDRGVTSDSYKLSDHETLRIITTVERLQLTQTQLSQLEMFAKDRKNRKCLLETEVHNITKFGRGLTEAKRTLKTGLGEALVQFRSSGSKKVLDLTLKQFEEGSYSIEKIDRFFQDNEPLFAKIAFADALGREGVIIVGDNKSKFDDIKRQYDVYVLFAEEKAKQTEPNIWSENNCVFFDIVKEGCKYTTFAYVNDDGIMRRENILKKIVIYHYQDGEVVCRDVAEYRAILASLNSAKCSQQMQQGIARPVKRAFVEFQCPGLSCSDSQRMWSCEVRHQQMEYGFDSYFYCSCGRAPMNTYSYKCAEESHGDFIQIDFTLLEKLTNRLQPINYLNILLLGETGVGKSTWINGFANYLSYETLEEAEQSDTVCLIPSQFTMTNENFEEVEVKTGDDSNEDHATEQSATQMPKSYVFRHEKTHVRLIDTPGIGDTRGIDHDRANMQNIMTHLANLDEINGIFILLKPNNARLTVMFSFCIKELLTHLHRDACRNIVFCFTNARGTFYRPGDTLPALKKLLSTNQDVDIQLSRDKIYCVDNEAIRFLAALKQGIQFDETQKREYATSWVTSVKENNRLINYVLSLTPHKVKNTISLNDARRLVLGLSRPIAEISQNIRDNIGVVAQKKKEIDDSVSRKKRLTEDKLKVNVVYLETTELGFPRTVCTDSSCVEYVSTGVGGVKETNYKTHCHEHCYVPGVEKNTVNCSALQHCAAMTGPNSTCGTCDHSWSVHMHITYKIEKKQRLEEDAEVQKLIANEATYIEGIQKMQRDLEARVKGLEKEEETVTKISARFACFLKKHAIAPYNDALADYLDHLIKDEQGKVAAGGNRDTLASLEKMKAMYEKEVAALETAWKDPTVKPMAAGEIKTLYDDLCNLEYSGENLKNIMKAAETGDAAADAYKETLVPHRVKLPKHADRPASGASKGYMYVSRAIGWVAGKLSGKP